MTIPFTPKFLVVAATAPTATGPRLVFRAGAVDSEPSWDPRLSFAHVQRLGHWSHYRWAAGHSFWPLGDVATIDEAAEVAAANGVLRKEPAQGAIALVAERRPAPRRSAWAQCGVVIEMETAEGSVLPGDKIWELDVAWEVIGAGRRSHTVVTRHRFDTAHGDAFIHWWKLPVERGDPSPATVAAAACHALRAA